MRYPALLITWLVTDLLVFLASYLLAYFVRVGFIFSSDLRLAPFTLTCLLTAPVWLAALATTRTFALTRRQASLRNGAYIVFACVLGTAVFALINYFGYQLVLSRMLLLYTMIFSIMATWVWHVVYSAMFRRELRRNPPVFPTLIIGANREAEQLIASLNKHHNPLLPVAVLDGRGTKEKEIAGVPVLGKLNKLEDVIKEKQITHLIQCSDLEQSLNLLSACRQHGIRYVVLPSVFGIVERDERIESLEGHPVTVVDPRERKLMWFFR